MIRIPRSQMMVAMVIIACATGLRLWNLGYGDMTGDDATYSLRSVGYVDYLAAPNTQQTPYDWFSKDQMPAWTSLSFHDAPPVALLAQHLFFSMFGESVAVARLPSALFGLLSILLLFLIGSELIGTKWGGLIAAGLLTFSQYAIWISRTALLEGPQQFFILLAVFCFIRWLGAPKYFWAVAVSLGLAILTKYTSAFLIPAFFVMVLIYRRDYFRNWRLYSAVAMLALLLLPLIIYNINMYQARGHFDLQITRMRGQSVADWPLLTRPGDSGGGVFKKFTTIFASVPAQDPFLVLVFVAGLVAAVLPATRSRRVERPLAILFILFGLCFFEMLALGNTDRFYSLFAPWLALIGAYGITKVSFVTKFPKLAYAAASLGLCVGAYFAISGSFFMGPFKPQSAGFNELDMELRKVFSDRRGADFKTESLLLNPSYPGKFANRIMLVYDENISWFPALWYFYRWPMYYYDVNILPYKDFIALIQKSGPGQLAKSAYSEIIFIRGVETLQDPGRHSNLAQLVGDNLERSGVRPVKTINAAGKTAFKIYAVPTSRL